MSADIELADRIVASGVGVKDAFRSSMYSLGLFEGVRYEAEEFVRDWRVAGAMMEKLMFEKGIWLDIEPDGCAYRESGDLPRAINEACAEALS